MVLSRDAYGKPRPALVIRSDYFDATTSVTVLPVTSELRAAVMIDKVQTVPRDKIGSTIGRLHTGTLVAVDRALAVFLGIA